MRAVEVFSKPSRRGASSIAGTRFRHRLRVSLHDSKHKMALSTSNNVHSTPRGLISRLARLSPAVPVRASDVEIILDPNDFYNQLNNRISTAQKRVILAALYLGNEPKPLHMVEVLRQSLSKNPDLEVLFVLDYLRGTRGIKKDTAEKPQSSAGIVQSLADQFPGRVRGAFWHTPRVSGLIKWLVPERVVELVGVQHIKCFIVDDDVMLSGANLSEQYFTDRQDRYYWFKNNAPLSGFYADLLHLIESLSFGLESAPNSVKHSDTGLSLPPGVPDPSVHPAKYKTLFKTKMEAFWASHMTNQGENAQLTTSNDTVVFPTCQVGPCDFTNDHQVIDTALAMVPSSETLHITTPYCNFTNDFTDIMFKQCEAPRINVIVAHPTANGFFKGKGAHTLIPWAYSSFLERFHALVASAGQMARVHLYEYERPEWTFHAKGLWFEFPKNQNDQQEVASVSVVGSSNFGFRSAQRDLEAQAVLVTQNEKLVQSMREERQYVFKTGLEVSEATFDDRKQHTPWWLPFIMFFAKRFM